MDRPLSQFAGHYREWNPVGDLSDHLSCIWVNDLTASSVKEYHVVPDACVDILWTGSGLYVAGPDTHPVLERVRPGTIIAGVRFRPGAAYPWLGVPLSEILNSRVALTEFWIEGGMIAEYVSAAPDSMAATIVLQERLRARLVQVGQADRQIAFLRNAAAAKFKDSDLNSVQDLARRMGVSERTLRRRCIDVFGYGFKTLQRIVRFQRFFRLATLSPDTNLAGLALEAGFADQPHMSREVRRLCAVKPLDLIAQLSR